MFQNLLSHHESRLHKVSLLLSLQYDSVDKILINSFSQIDEFIW